MAQNETKTESSSDVVLGQEPAESQPMADSQTGGEVIICWAGFRRRRGQKNGPRVVGRVGRSCLFRSLLSCRGLCLFCCSLSQVLAACPACVGRLFPASFNSPIVTYLFESIPLQRALSLTYAILLVWRAVDKLQRAPIELHDSSLPLRTYPRLSW